MFVFLFFFFSPQISFHLGRLGLGQIPEKKMIAVCFVFLESGSWIELRDSEDPSEKGSCSVRSRTFREEKLYRERAILEKPHQPAIQLVFAISHETQMHQKQVSLFLNSCFIY